MNHPLEFAQRIIHSFSDPLSHIKYLMDHEHSSRHKKGRNKEIKFWKKVKNHIKELMK